MKLRIVHQTAYRYAHAPRRSVQTLRMMPQDSEHQRILAWTVETPVAAQVQQDAWGNTVHLVSHERPARRLVCVARGEVETLGCPMAPDGAGPPPVWYAADSTLAAPSADLRAWTALVLPLTAGMPLQPRQALALADAVADTVCYTPGATDAHTSAARAFELGRGVCQDQAHVFIAACRSLGLPARYVSGYFHAQAVAYGPAHAALASHAWAEVCVDLPRRHWLAVDVTHRCLIDQRHVRVAVGPDYAACAPVRGVVSGGSGEQLTVDVQISVINGTG
ncbi:MAG: transglutaminase family protein [Burkholderiales bacterium]